MKRGNPIVASRYARSLLRSVDPERREQFQQYFDAIAELFAVPEAEQVLVSRVLSEQLKLELLNYALTPFAVDETFTSFLHSVLRAGRIALIVSIGEFYSQMVLEQTDTVEAEVWSAFELSSDDIKAVAGSLEGALGKQISYVYKVDPGLLGGALIKLGNLTLDLSLKARIDRLSASI